jgi:O-antigen ligase
MNKNVGNPERLLRVMVGLALMALAATGTLGAWAWLGVVPLATGVLGWCPPYAMLGINTCSMKSGGKGA